MPALVRRGFPLPTTQSSTSPCTGEEIVWVRLAQFPARERELFGEAGTAYYTGEVDYFCSKGWAW